ncbi:MAG TPA: undecaprenyl-phosphate glucose phosphotransferase [Candidatus Sulfotelmatobacter sp.]|nr:undecaprenyl-phosphate glucose phosphotransferase [Candidatus Sulfotelmatobacter sp.]
MFTALVETSDILVITMSAALAYVVYLGERPTDPGLYFVATVLAAFFGYLAFRSAGLYEMRRIAEFHNSIRSLAIGWGSVFAGLAIVSFLVKAAPDYSRAWTIMSFAFGFLGLLTTRYGFALLHARWAREGRLAHVTLLLGGGELGVRVSKRLRESDSHMQVVGFFDDRRARVPNAIEGLPWLGGSDDLLRFVIEHPIDSVIIALPLIADERIDQLIRDLRQHPVDVFIVPDFLGLRLGETVAAKVWSAVPGVLLVPVASRPIAGWGGILKTIEDKVIAALALALFGPLMLVIAATIKLTSPGPVLFRQPRIGYNQREFSALKFRTMHHAMSMAKPDRLTTRGDPRITPLGALLRKTSLDELPQLINVLRGEMSIVGPRPHVSTARAADKLYNEAVTEYAARHRVKPGITGWAQVNGWRGPTETIEQIQKRVEHDIYYIDNWSIALDLWIIALTAVKGFFSRNAF